MKPKTAKHNIDAAGTPHGDWRRIIGRNLDNWNREQDKSHKEENE